MLYWALEGFGVEAAIDILLVKAHSLGEQLSCHRGFGYNWLLLLRDLGVFGYLETRFGGVLLEVDSQALFCETWAFQRIGGEDIGKGLPAVSTSTGGQNIRARSIPGGFRPDSSYARYEASCRVACLAS